MSTRKKTIKKKGKVFIPPYKIIIFCSVIILTCILLLVITSFFSSKNVKNELNNSVENEEIKQKEKKELNLEILDENIEFKQSEKVEQISKISNENIEFKPNEIVEQNANKIDNKNTILSNEKSKKEDENLNENIETKPKSKFDFPNAKNSAQLIFVFDDAGQNIEQLKTFLDLPFPITVAVLPQLPNSKKAAHLIRQSNNEVILHQPMQAINQNVNPGNGAITPNMNEDEIISTLFNNIYELSPISGINNHEGSQITADIQKVETILKFAQQENLYFLDSRTNVQTKIPFVAKSLGFSYFERNIFLDNKKTSENVILELKKGIELANKNGSVIMIGHIWSSDFLPKILNEAYFELIEKGYTFSTVGKSNAIKN